MLLAICGPRDDRSVQEVVAAMSGFRAKGMVIDGRPYICFIPVSQP